MIEFLKSNTTGRGEGNPPCWTLLEDSSQIAYPPSRRTQTIVKQNMVSPLNVLLDEEDVGCRSCLSHVPSLVSHNTIQVQASSPATFLLPASEENNSQNRII
ncbi:hypothetical protein PR048_024048 [Dryococelus australis]|uniref:Uncharacterized protein n=1 Tax=Dryococelus australis TaxID=614101 RepID=A0ABQ9GVT1_9NEOP|nr:hypothetical protein PR048_024048 [Dryococelus australis]